MSHGSLTKSGKTRDRVNKDRNNRTTKHHSKKHNIPIIANRKKYKKLMRSSRKYSSNY